MKSTRTGRSGFRIPRDLRERSPLLCPSGLRMLRRLTDHPDAPRFNYAAGDRLRREDLRGIARFRERLRTERGPRGPAPPPSILRQIAAHRERVPFFRHLPEMRLLEREWESLPTTSREDLALRPWEFVPERERLDRLVIYRTAGTTGHPIAVPHHPAAIRCYEPMLEFALERHGVRLDLDARTVACFLIASQIRTYTYAAVLHTWRGAGFVKLNLRPTEWPGEGARQRYFADLAPRFLTGDPVSFTELLRLDLPVQPAALVTTAVAMSPALRKRLVRRYRVPVIDWYSLVETGPIAYACPLGRGHHLLPHDLHIETLREDGFPAAEGEMGEITVTGGRNLLTRLFRYRTGDRGRLDYSKCRCGDPMPRVLDLEGRALILFRSADSTPVSTVDVSRLLREFPLLLHQFVQRADRSCELTVRPLPGARVALAGLRATLARVLGPLPLRVRIDRALGDEAGGKVIPYRSEVRL